jgi:hypothetical protein
MITSAVSSAVRLSLAPARLAGRVAGSLLSELRGNGSTDPGPPPSPAGTSTAARRKRDGAAARAKAQPKRAAAGTRAKVKSKRPASRTRASARTKRQPKPLDDVTIARKVESTIFRDIEVDKGNVDVNVAERVVWLRGEVDSQDLINELEARATEVTEVRRVENLLHVPEAPAPGRTDTAALQSQTEGTSSARPETPGVVAGESSAEAAELDQDADGDGSSGQEAAEVAEVDQEPQGDVPHQQGPGAVGLAKDSAYQSRGAAQPDRGGG